MATVNYKCPNCGGPLKFNPDKQMFSCEYCLSDFTEEKIQQLYAEKEAKESQAEKQEKKSQKKRAEQKANDTNKEDEEAVIYTCPSCGAEVVTTASTAATTCFYCQNPVVLGGRLAGKYKPDRLIPFALSKEKAIEKFLEMCNKKHFLPKAFASKEHFDKLSGVYFPYWYVDSQRNAHLSARAEKIKTWRTGDQEYTETSRYKLVRGGDVIVKNVFERALKSQDRDMLQCVQPFDMGGAKPFSMSFLSGFQAEKRDIEKNDISDMVDKRVKKYCEEVLRDTINGYTAIQVEDYHDKVDLESWNYTLLPVWVVTYKYNNKIYPFAINGQTGKTFGMLPASKAKLALLGAILATIFIILGVLGGLLFL